MFALLPAAALVFVLVTLAVEAIPAIKLNGLVVLHPQRLEPGRRLQRGRSSRPAACAHLAGSQFGVLPEIVGTLLTSAIALLIAVPVSVGAALVIVERLPRRLASLRRRASWNCWPASPAWSSACGAC